MRQSSKETLPCNRRHRSRKKDSRLVSRLMINEQLMVAAFHEKAGAVINQTPAFIDRDTAELRLNLIDEELTELEEAFYPSDGIIDLVDVADAIGDLLYVVLGIAVSCGINIEPIFH